MAPERMPACKGLYMRASEQVEHRLYQWMQLSVPLSMLSTPLDALTSLLLPCDTTLVFIASTQRLFLCNMVRDRGDCSALSNDSCTMECRTTNKLFNSGFHDCLHVYVGHLVPRETCERVQK